MYFTSFVWRQLELAFFGAVTSVAALFIFIEKGERQMKQATYQKPEIEIIKLNIVDLIYTSGSIGKDDGSNDGEWID